MRPIHERNLNIDLNRALSEWNSRWVSIGVASSVPRGAVVAGVERTFVRTAASAAADPNEHAT